MKRRIALLVLALVLSWLAAPAAVNAQRPEKIYRIGMLERTSTAINAANLEGFRQGLRELGYVEGKNFVLEYRSADGRDERFPGLATELVRLQRSPRHEGDGRGDSPDIGHCRAGRRTGESAPC